MVAYTDATSVFLADGEPQDISETYFVNVLRDAGSFDVDALWEPFTLDERPEAAREVYRVITAARQRASYWLAKAFEEHGAGTNQNSVLWRGKTRSWGNATSVRLASLTGWTAYFDEFRGRVYIRYANVIDSIKDATWRIADPAFVYVKEGRRSVRQVAERFVGLDSPNKENYIAGHVRRMNQYVVEDGNEPMIAPQIQIPGVKVEWYVWKDKDGKKVVGADSDHYTKGRTHPIKQIVHHHSDGWDSRNWLTHTSPNNVSAHFLVNYQGTKVWQLVRLEDTAHTQGTHNPWSVGIEWERYWTDPTRRQTEVPEKVYDTLAKLDMEIAAHVLQHGFGHIGYSRESILRHGEVNDTACPQNLDVDRIVQQIRGSVDNAIHFPTGYNLQHGFADFYRSLGDRAWAAVGYPIENELADIDNGEYLVTVQRTDVGWLQYNPITGEVRMATENQRKAIEVDLGIGDHGGVTLGRQREIGEILVRVGNELRLSK